MTLQTPVSLSKIRILKNYSKKLQKLNINTLEDLLYHIPHRYEDYSNTSPIDQVQPGQKVTIQGEITNAKNQYLRSKRIKAIQKVTITDDTGSIDLTWFNQPYLIKQLPLNARISASGRAGKSASKPTLMSPQFEILSDSNNTIHTSRLIPIYHETKGVTSKWLRRQIHQLLERHKDEIAEHLPIEIIKKFDYPTFPEAVRQIHFPKSLESMIKAKQRLSFDELFLIQLSNLKKRSQWLENNKGIPLNFPKYKTQINKLINSLPFTLTNAQQIALQEITSDLSLQKPMNRLLQGDVGSGKTIVAAISMYLAHLNGYKSILLTPTQILATQHYKTISRLLSPLGTKTDLITGNRKISNQQNLNSSAVVGLQPAPEQFLNTDIIIGTHALLSEKIKIDNLALTVIDEQQRFGVEQRSLIREKGKNTHLLTMTATPIPRTMALTLFGDLDLSVIDEMPKNRKKIKTWLVPQEKRKSAYQWIKNQIKQNKTQAFIICPFIEPSESLQTIKAASKEFELLKKEIFPDLRLNLLHGRQKPKEKEVIMQDFKNKKFDILVATPIVEVGIDIPHATIIMIEASERFGLPQIHQLRGRVGRNDKDSYCLLFTETQNSETSQRLKFLETNHSGSKLAELDLKLRGSGDIFGTAQSGFSKLKIASFSEPELIRSIKQEAKKIFPNLDKHPLLQEKINALIQAKISPD